jgi:hypothetical protein
MQTDGVISCRCDQPLTLIASTTPTFVKGEGGKCLAFLEEKKNLEEKPMWSFKKKGKKIFTLTSYNFLHLNSNSQIENANLHDLQSVD